MDRSIKVDRVEAIVENIEAIKKISTPVDSRALLISALETLVMQIEDQGLKDRFALGLSKAEYALTAARNGETKE